MYLFDPELLFLHVEDLRVENEADLVRDVLGAGILPRLERVLEGLEVREFPFPYYVLSVLLRFAGEHLCVPCPPFSFCSSLQLFQQ